jgi:hypothetical protein
VSASVSGVAIRHWILVLGVGVVAAATRGGAVGVAVLFGGGVMGASLHLYAIGLRILVRRGSPRLALGALFVKLTLFLGVGWVVFSSEGYRPDAVGFAAGVSCLPVAAAWEAIRTRRV